MDLWTPDAFHGDAYGWITNQAGHALIVGAMPFAVLSLVMPRVFAWAVLSAAYAMWELWQGGEPLDGLADWFFVAAGAALVWAAWERSRLAAAAWAALALAFAIGTWRRK